MPEEKNKQTFQKSEAQPTQNFVEIESIRDNTLILKDGGLRQILAVSGINFLLQSEDEQEIIINLFQNFLNSLDFTIQIFIHSRKLNIEGYLENLESRKEKESNELLKNQISEYREFIKAFVSENTIMHKTYFVVIPYDAIKIPQKSIGVTDKLFGFLGKKGIQKPTERIANEKQSEEETLLHHIEQLEKRTFHVISGLNQMNLRAIPLNQEELVEIFYNLYNPQTIEKKGLAMIVNREK